MWPRRARAAHVPLDDALGNADSELEKLASDSFCPQQPVLQCHAPDELDHLRADSGLRCGSAFRRQRQNSLTARAATMSCCPSNAFSASSSACDLVTSPMNPPTTPGGRSSARSAVFTRVTRAVTRDRTRAQMMRNTAPSDLSRAGSSSLVDPENLNNHAEEEQVAGTGFAGCGGRKP